MNKCEKNNQNIKYIKDILLNKYNLSNTVNRIYLNSNQYSIATLILALNNKNEVFREDIIIWKNNLNKYLVDSVLIFVEKEWKQIDTIKFSLW